MTDITERLRGWAGFGYGVGVLTCMREAADEIERLQEQVLALQHIADRDEAEIERLRGMLVEYKAERRISVIKKFLEGK